MIVLHHGCNSASAKSAGFFLCLFIYLPLHFQQILVTQFLLTTGEEAPASSENEPLEGK